MTDDPYAYFQAEQEAAFRQRLGDELYDDLERRSRMKLSDPRRKWLDLIFSMTIDCMQGKITWETYLANLTIAAGEMVKEVQDGETAD